MTCQQLLPPWQDDFEKLYFNAKRTIVPLRAEQLREESGVNLAAKCKVNFPPGF